MGPVSIGMEVQRNTDGDTPSRSDIVLSDPSFRDTGCGQRVEQHIICM